MAMQVLLVYIKSGLPFGHNDFISQIADSTGINLKYQKAGRPKKNA